MPIEARQTSSPWILAIAAVLLVIFGCANNPVWMNALVGFGAASFHARIPRLLVTGIGDLFLLTGLEIFGRWRDIQCVITDGKFRYRLRTPLFLNAPWIDAAWADVMILAQTEKRILLVVEGRKVEIAQDLPHFHEIAEAIRTKASPFSLSPAQLSKNPLLSRLSPAELVSIFVHLSDGRKEESIQELQTSLSVSRQQACSIVDSLRIPFTRPLFLKPISV